MTRSGSIGSGWVRGFLFALDRLVVTDFPNAETEPRVEELLGERPAPPLRLTAGLSIWQGAGAKLHAEANQTATMVARGVARAVAEGRHGAGRRERARAVLLAAALSEQVLRGACVFVCRDEAKLHLVPDTGDDEGGEGH